MPNDIGAASVGAAVSMMTVALGDDPGLELPAASKARTSNVCVPSGIGVAGVIVYGPSAATGAVVGAPAPSTYILICPPASAVPANVGVLTLVMLSVSLTP